MSLKFKISLLTDPSIKEKLQCLIIKIDESKNQTDLSKYIEEFKTVLDELSYNQKNEFNVELEDYTVNHYSKFNNK